MQSVIFSPDGRQIFSGSFDGQIRAWDVAGRQLSATADAYPVGQPLSALAISPEGRRLASASMGTASEVKLWDAGPLELQQVLPCPSPVYCLAFSPDSEHLASAGEHEVHLWSAKDGALLRTLDVDTVPIFSLAFSPDGAVLYTAGNPHVGKFFARTGVVRAWHVRTGTKLGEIELPHTGFGLALSQDGQTLAVAAVALHVFDVTRTAGAISFRERFSALEEQSKSGVPYFQEQFCQVAMPSEGNMIAAAAGSPGPHAPDAGHVRLFDGEGQRLATLATPRLPHAVSEPGEYEIRTVTISPDGRLVAAGGNEGVVTLWSQSVAKGARGDDPARIRTPSALPKPNEKLAGTTSKEERSTEIEPLPENASPAARKFWELNRSYRLSRETLHRTLTDPEGYAPTHEQQWAVESALCSQAKDAERLLEIAREYPKDPAGFDALALSLYLCRTPRTPELHERRCAALEQLSDGYFADPELSRLFYMLERVPSVETEGLLIKALAQHPEVAVRAHAAYSLAQYYRHLSQASRLCQQNTDLRGQARRAFGGDAVSILQAMDPDELREKSREYYRLVQQRFPEVFNRPETYSRLQDQQLTQRQGHSLGELAERQLLALQQLNIGQKAPEVIGEDIDGTPFKLSDYRGRVVALVFSADWCGPCRQMYEHERALVEQLKNEPFTLLHVNSDYNREEVKRLVEKGTITWRCWWDGPGPEGPTSVQWNIEARPDVYVLDGNGVIRYRGVRGDSLSRALRQLLAEMAAK